MQLGKSARLNSKIDLKDTLLMLNYWASIYFDTTMEEKEILTQFQKEFPELNWSTSQMIVDVNVGGIQGTMKSMLLPITLMLSLLIMLITILMEQLFIFREKGEIAMLKSIGF